jgi:hypothetical protein
VQLSSVRFSCGQLPFGANVFHVGSLFEMITNQPICA